MKRLCALALLFCLITAVIPAARAGDYYADAILSGADGTVTIYKKASTSGGTVGRFYNGVTVSYYSADYSLKSKWLKVTLEGRGITLSGYVRGTDLADGYVEIAPYTFDLNKSIPRAFPRAVAAQDNAAIYDGTGTKAKTIGRLIAGVPVYVLGDCGDQYFISVAGAETHGFMDKSALNLTGETGSDDADIAPIAESVVYATDAQGLSAVPVYGSCAKYEQPSLGVKGGDTVSILGQWGDWSLIAAKGLYIYRTGFIETRFLDEHGDHSLPVLYIRTDKPNNRLLLRDNYINDEYYGKFFQGVKVTRLTEQDAWDNTEYTYVYVGGNYGYFLNEYLAVTPTAAPRYAVVTETTYGYEVNSYNTYDGNLRFDKGERVTLLGSRDAMMYILKEDGRYSSLPIECLSPANDDFTFTAKVDASSLKMRGAPSEDGKALRSISKNTSVKVLLHGDVWSQIEYKGEVGYVMTRYLKY